MNLSANHVGDDRSCSAMRRRTFLADLGLGFTGLALGAMLQREGSAAGVVGAKGATGAWV
jgi:hypothetical protein